MKKSGAQAKNSRSFLWCSFLMDSLFSFFFCLFRSHLFIKEFESCCILCAQRVSYAISMFFRDSYYPK